MNSSPLNTIGFFSLDRRLMLQTYDQLIDRCRGGNLDDILKTGTVIRDASDKARKFPPKIMTSMLIPALDKAAEKIVAAEARRRCVFAAIEVEEFRRRHNGNLPTSLNEPGPVTPNDIRLDPFDGQRLRYLPGTNGYVIYSVGPDMEDNEGELTKQRGPNPKQDIGVRIERITDTATLPRSRE